MHGPAYFEVPRGGRFSRAPRGRRPSALMRSCSRRLMARWRGPESEQASFRFTTSAVGHPTRIWMGSPRNFVSVFCPKILHLCGVSQVPRLVFGEADFHAFGARLCGVVGAGLYGSFGVHNVLLRARRGRRLRCRREPGWLATHLVPPPPPQKAFFPAYPCPLFPPR